MSPTARSLALLRKAGFLPAVVERWIPGANVRADLWHFGDVLAVHAASRAFVIVQVTTLGHLAARLAKARARPELGTWLAAGGQFEVHGWTLRNGRWACKRVAVRAGDLEAVAIALPPRQRRKPRDVTGDLFAGLDGPPE